MIKGSRLIAAALLLLLSLACFISTPVFAEGPWDGDSNASGDDGGGGVTDSTDDGDGSDGDDAFKDFNDGGDDWEWIFLKSIIRIVFISITQGSTSSASFN